METSEHPTFGHGKICYIEIPSVDINASANFYQKVFGWNIRKDGSGNTSFDDTVGEVSGMWVTGRKPSAEIGFVISIMVDSIAATVELIKLNGGKIIKVDADSNEKTAWFSDPAGNIFGLYQQ
jgi:uncharacterized protein